MKIALTIVLFVFFTLPAMAQKGKLDLETTFQLNVNPVVFPEPRHEIVIVDPENDLWIAPPVPCQPVPGRVCPPTTPVPDFLSATAKTNGVNTWLDLNFSNGAAISRAQWVVFFDTDQNPKTGFDPSFSTDQREFEPRIGYDAVVYSNDFRAKVCGPDECQYIPVEFVGQTIKLVIPNEALGAYAGGDMNIALMVSNEDGVTDVAPNQGYVTITSTVNAKLSPGDSRMSTIQPVDLAIIAELDDPSNTTVRKIVRFDGRDVTVEFEQGEIVGAIQSMGYHSPEKQGSTRAGKSFRYSIQPGWLPFGRHVLETIVITGRGLSYSQVEWIVVPGTEQPAPPRP